MYKKILQIAFSCNQINYWSNHNVWFIWILYSLGTCRTD